MADDDEDWFIRAVDALLLALVLILVVRVLAAVVAIGLLAWWLWP